MTIRHAVLILIAAVLIVSCSEKSAPDREKDSAAAETPRESRESKSKRAEDENESQPEADQIAEHCLAFVRATRVVPAQGLTADCPGCPADGTEILQFRQLKTERISCSGDTCTVLVTLVASFNPGAGERIDGGLAAWISPEQRSDYLSGRTPAGEQTFGVQITYKRRADGWRAVEFDRAPVQ